MSGEVIVGTVENGERVILKSTVFSGVAGVQRVGEHVEVAYFGEPPHASQLPLALTMQTGLSQLHGDVTGTALSWRRGAFNGRRNAPWVTVLIVRLD